MREVFQRAIDSGLRMQAACREYDEIPTGRENLEAAIAGLRMIELVVAEHRADMEEVARAMGVRLREEARA